MPTPSTSRTPASTSASVSAPTRPTWTVRARPASSSARSPRSAKWADVIMNLTPDQTAAKVYHADIEPNLAPGKTLMFAHGFNIRFRTITPPAGVDVSLVAPKAPGHRVREVFTEGGGVPAPRRRRAGRERATRLKLALSYAKASAAPAAPASLRPPSPRRPRPTSSASRPSSAAAPPRSSSAALRSSPRPATSRSSPTSKSSTNSSSSST